MIRRFSDSQWRDDLRFMVMEMERIHPNLFHDVSEQTFREATVTLSQMLPKLSDNEITTGFLKIVALTRDWHTQIISKNLSRLWFPLLVRKLKDGLFVFSTSSQYTHFLGARLVEIGSFSADEALLKVKSVTAHDNTCSQDYFAPMFFSVPDVLNGLRINADSDTLRLVVQLFDGEKREVIISAGEFDSDDDLSWYWKSETAPTQDCVKLIASDKSLPGYWKDVDRYYWFEYLEAAKAIYLAFNMTLDSDVGENFKDFTDRMWEFVDRQRVKRLIIDLRHNLGGDHDILSPLIDGVIQRQRINRQDNLFVLIGPKNVSASAHCAAWLENRANPTFVGEPTGARPNHYADPEHIRLPNSQLRLMVSHRYWQNSRSGDSREFIQPHILAEFTSKDHLNFTDPAMEMILNLT